MNACKIRRVLPFIAILPFVFWVFFDTRLSGARNLNVEPSLYSSILRYFEFHSIPILTADSEKQSMMLSVNLDGNKSLVIINVDETESLVFVRCPFPWVLTQIQMSKLAVDFMHLNQKIYNGNFEMDTVEKLLLFKHSINNSSFNVNDSTLYYEITWTITQMEEVIPLVLQKAGISFADTTNNTMPEMS